MDGTAIVITDGKLHERDAKTAHGLIRGSGRYEILGVIDHLHVGEDAGKVVDGKQRDIPIFSTVSEAKNQIDQKIDFCIVGIATVGGKITKNILAPIREGIRQKISIINGLHDFLNDEAELVELAKEYGVELIDVRKPKPKKELHFWSGKISEVSCPKIAVLGTDCAVGKRTTARFLVEESHQRGKKAEMIYTGQTGWLQGGKYGFIFDTTVNDFISGEIEHAIHSCFVAEKPDLIVVEGQSALRNPSGPCGAEFLVSGRMDGVILQHRPAQQFFDGNETWGRLPSVASEIELIRLYGVDTLALTLNTRGLTLEEAKFHQKTLTKELRIPVFLPLEEGLEGLYDVIAKHFF